METIKKIIPTKDIIFQKRSFDTNLIIELVEHVDPFEAASYQEVTPEPQRELANEALLRFYYN